MTTAPEARRAFVGVIEVRADLFRRVHTVHPVAVVHQYSLWTGDVEQVASMAAGGGAPQPGTRH
ncbi:hypothetical protein [Mycobacterium sp. PSTR-4-N]|uniref:hypothetical protein n=1 Tax=Mycobacterium sp. PSTR-4-N TaxID=2917745 RepID=UPI001F149CCC|nr:hypothetical protein [Mycobacterium sp. PSTR-4-N]MCG7595231.1 hypothetical protein [Mycobacterium sp. PSTR-4-N]